MITLMYDYEILQDLFFTCVYIDFDSVDFIWLIPIVFIFFLHDYYQKWSQQEILRIYHPQDLFEYDVYILLPVE